MQLPEYITKTEVQRVCRELRDSRLDPTRDRAS